MKINIFDYQEFEPRSTCQVATAIVGSALIGGAASIAGSSMASNAQENANERAINEQRAMFGETKAALNPFIQGGQSMIPQLQGWTDPTQSTSPLAALLKLTAPGANMNEALAQTPGYQFTQTMGQKAVNNALAARGLAGPGGPLARGSADYASGLASTTWQNVVNALMGTYQAGATGLQNLVNTGAGAAGALGGNATQVGGQIGQNMVGIGNAQAGGVMSGANAIGGIGNSVGTAAILQKLLGGNSGSAGVYGGGAETNGAWYA